MGQGEPGRPLVPVIGGAGEVRPDRLEVLPRVMVGVGLVGVAGRLRRGEPVIVKVLQIDMALRTGLVVGGADLFRRRPQDRIRDRLHVDPQARAVQVDEQILQALEPTPRLAFGDEITAEVNNASGHGEDPLYCDGDWHSRCRG